MALIECPECNRKVSAEATVCPGCGKRLRAALWVKAMAFVGLAFGVFMAYGFYLESLPGAKEAHRAREAYDVCVKLARTQGSGSQPCEHLLDDFEAKYGRRP
jgi:uncharacterized protein (UPF0212 family)